MKYIKPALLVVELRTVHMMAESLIITSEETIQNSSDILTKEQTITDVNVWDEEW